MTEIRLDKLRKEFKDVVAVRDVTMTFPDSEVTCLLGPSGCGKTTLLRMIAGLENPSSGDVYFGKERVTDLPPSKRNIGMVFQYPVVYRGTTVYRNIELPLLQERITDGERRQRIERVVDVLGLRDHLNRYTDELDTSTRQKVAVARTVARQPEIILFDEPLTNVDIDTRVQLKQALKELTAQLRKTILYVTHDQTDAMTLASQIADEGWGGGAARLPQGAVQFPNDVFGDGPGQPGHEFRGTGNRTQRRLNPAGVSVVPAPLRISGVGGNRRITLGIRPERVHVDCAAMTGAVQGEITALHRRRGPVSPEAKVGELTLKAKTDRECAQRIHDEVWVECPLEWVTVFDADGDRRRPGWRWRVLRHRAATPGSGGNRQMATEVATTDAKMSFETGGN